MITCQTAFLKAHYPVEYMTALLSVSKNDTAKVAVYCADCRRMGIPVLPPDIRQSGLDFTIEDTAGPAAAGQAIRFGLSAVKNVGEAAVETILRARAAGPFTALDDFTQRTDLRQVGKRALECLIKVGALDSFGARGQMLVGLDAVLNASAEHFRAAEAGQLTMFGASTQGSGFGGVTLPKVKTETTRKEMLAWEKELIGLYVSDHPLQPVMAQLQAVVTHYSQSLTEDDDGQGVVMAGVVTNLRPHQTKKGDAMGFVSVDDLQGHLELVVFPKVWREVKNWLAMDQIVVIRGKVDAKGTGTPKVLVDSIRQDFETTAASANGAARPAPVEPPAWLDDEQPPDDDLFPPVLETPIRPAPASPAETRGTGTARGGGAEPEAASRIPAAAPSAPMADSTAPIVSPKPNGGNGHGGAHAAREAPLARPAAPVRAQPRRVIVTIHSSGDRDRDKRRMRRLHGLLLSYPGADKFEFMVREDQRNYQLRFPNDSTGYCPALEHQLLELLGPGAVEVQPL